MRQMRLKRNTKKAYVTFERNFDTIETQKQIART